jgi:hypothetical protein
MSQLNLNRDLLWAVVDDGRIFIHTADGKRIVGEIFCRITDENGSLPKVILKAIVNVVGSVEEMNEKIEFYNAR